MSNKRGSSNPELNKDNYDDDDKDTEQSEQGGTWKKAPPEELARRRKLEAEKRAAKMAARGGKAPIKTTQDRVQSVASAPPSSSSSSSSPSSSFASTSTSSSNPFASFKGFGAATILPSNPTNTKFSSVPNATTPATTTTLPKPLPSSAKKPEITQPATSTSPATATRSACDASELLLKEIASSLVLTDMECLQRGMSLLDPHPTIPLTSANLRSLAPLLFAGRLFEAELLLNTFPSGAKDNTAKKAGRVGLGDLLKELIAESGRETAVDRFERAVELMEHGDIENVFGSPLPILPPVVSRELKASIVLSAVSNNRLDLATSLLRELSEYKYDSTRGKVFNPSTVIALGSMMKSPVQKFSNIEMPLGPNFRAPYVDTLELLFPRQILSSFHKLNLLPSPLPSTSQVGNILDLGYTCALLGTQSGEKHGCILFDRHNTPLSVGWNHNYSVQKTMKNKNKKVIHAEVHAICQVSDPTSLIEGSVWVVEVHRDKKSYCDAFPCPSCTNVLIKVGIKRAYFTKFNGELGRWEFPKQNAELPGETLGFAKEADTWERPGEEVKGKVRRVLCDWCVDQEGGEAMEEVGVKKKC